jgi:hypothetical protein
MLHEETIEPSTLELLIQLQRKDYLKGFYLVGGTALSLLIGHRKSVDLDLFSDFGFNTGDILEKLSSDFGYYLYFSAGNTLKGRIEDVEVDLIAHRYPLIREPLKFDTVSMLSMEDITAMKLNAIAVSGQRSKDFIDIFYLLEKYSIAEMISFYKTKYTQYNEVNVLKSLTWFEDVDLSDWPVMIKAPAPDWEVIKRRIVEATKDYLRNNKDLC